jgi:putative transposase
MNLVECHKIDKKHEYYKECDVLAFKSKNLFNACLFVERQNYFNHVSLSGQTTNIIQEGNLVGGNYNQLYNAITISGQTTNCKYLDYVILDKIFNKTNNVDYRALPAKVAKQIIIQVSKSYKSFFNALTDYKTNPFKYKGKPQIPNYKDKTDGRNVVTYELNAINNKNHKNGDWLLLSGTNIKIEFKNKRTGTLKQIRIVPCLNYYNIEIIYEVKEKEKVVKTKAEAKHHNAIGIDLGVKNLCTLSNNFGAKPLIINGGGLKSLNKYSNELIGKSQKLIPKDKKGNPISYTTEKIQWLYTKRENKLDTELHCISKYIVNHCLENDVKTIVIGYNKNWKQNINLGKNTNQHFTYIPYLELISKITYKAELEGIKVFLNEESYTSKCSFFDDEKIGKHEIYKGKRTKRGLFITNKGVKLNADVNAAFNILKKVVGNFVADIGQAVSPVKINLGFAL